MTIVKTLTEKGLIKPPQFVSDQTIYETQMGSVAYGCSTSNSDFDVYGICIPYKDIVFPHLSGEIIGFGRQQKRFDSYQQHHIFYNDVEYDINIMSIVKFFSLAMENNPNVLDSLFVPQRCILSSSKIAQNIRDNRKLFLHKGSFHKFRGYAHAQLHKMKEKKVKEMFDLEQKYEVTEKSTQDLESNFQELSKKGTENEFRHLISLRKEVGTSKRLPSIRKHGFDVKFAYHVIRLMRQCEQILTEHDMDIERYAEEYRRVREGKMTLEEIESFFEENEKKMFDLYDKSTLRHSPDEESIKELLLNCLEEHFGSLKELEVTRSNKSDQILNQIRSLLK